MENTFKRYFRPGVVIVAVCLICGSLYGQSRDDTTINGEIPDFRGQKLTFLVNQSHNVGAQFLASRFNEKTGAVVEIVTVHYTELDEIILGSRDTGIDYDLFMPWYIFLGKLVDEDILVDLTDFIGDNREVLQTEDYLETFYDSFTQYKGRRWGLPFDGDVHALFYNKVIFDEYGIEPPVTWDEFKAVSEKITELGVEKGIYGSSVMAEPNPYILCSVFMNRLNAHGISVLTSDGKPNLDSEESIAALESLLQDIDSAMPKAREMGFQASVDAFLTGRVAMQENWSDVGIMAEDNRRSTIKGQWDMLPMPVLQQGDSHYLSMNTGYLIGISSNTRNLALAKAFLLFVSEPQIMLELNMIPGGGGFDPVRRSTIYSPDYVEFAPIVSKFHQNSLSNARPWETVPEAYELYGVLSRYLTFAVDREMTATQALRQASGEWTNILSR